VISVEVIADSAYLDTRLTTVRVRYPRIILAEVNTHRAFSRNAASTRAISLDRQLAAVWHDPYIPAEWPATQRGMSGGAPLADCDADRARTAWLEARDHAVIQARELQRLGVHRQHIGRLIEPWAWVDAIISATDWDNFFALRIAPDAQPEICALAIAIRDALAASTPRPVGLQDWHIPWHIEDPRISFVESLIATGGRLARVSYGRTGGECDPLADLALGRRLIAAGHWSPFEHIAIAHYGAAPSNFRKWIQYRHELERKVKQGEM
jgi:hypothetical protein